MAKQPKLYTRLSRSAGGLGSYQSLWLGPDHLMIVTSTGYSESYARLQFRDIKGFFITDSDRRMMWGVAWGFLVAIFAIILYVILDGHGTPVFSLAMLILSAGFFLWNYFLGPGCRAYVVTGVQTAKLPAVVRRKKAQKVLARLRPLLEAAQADLVSAPPVIVPPGVADQPPVVSAGSEPAPAPVAPSLESSPAPAPAPTTPPQT